MSTFKPYRKPLKTEKPLPDKQRVTFTNELAEAIQHIVLAYDCYPNDGAISIRDRAGNIWELTLERSDAKYLRSENPHENRTRKPD
jgi:formylglycine-generating enzyme required for sulfatase activity